MKLTLRQVVCACNTLEKIKDENINIQLAYSILTLFKQLSEETQKFLAIRDNKIKSYGEEKNGNIEVKEENRETFFKEINELLENTIDFDILETIQKDKLVMQDIKISASDMANLEPIFK